MDAGGEYTGRKNNKNSGLAFFRREFVQNLVRPIRYSMSALKVGNDERMALGYRYRSPVITQSISMVSGEFAGCIQELETRDKKPSVIIVSDIEI